MGIENPDTQNETESVQELRALQQELAPVFDLQHVAFGHGTDMRNASAILSEGLRAATPLLQSTAIPLEDTPKGMKTILHWPHHAHNAVIVISVPIDAPKDAELFDVRDTANTYESGYVLPPRLIRGYIDVEQKKFVSNPAFEENPIIRTRSSEATSARLSAFDTPAEGPVEVPAPKEGTGPVEDVF